MKVEWHVLDQSKSLYREKFQRINKTLNFISLENSILVFKIRGLTMHKKRFKGLQKVLIILKQKVRRNVLAYFQKTKVKQVKRIIVLRLLLNVENIIQRWKNTINGGDRK